MPRRTPIRPARRVPRHISSSERRLSTTVTARTCGDNTPGAFAEGCVPSILSRTTVNVVTGETSLRLIFAYPFGVLSIPPPISNESKRP